VTYKTIITFSSTYTDVTFGKKGGVTMERNHHHRKPKFSLFRYAVRLVSRLIGLLAEALAVSLALYLILVLIKPEPQIGIVKGNVLLGAEPVEGVTMTLVKDEVVAASVLTAEDGSFEFDPVAIGSYTLNAHKDVPEGYLTATEEIEVTGDGVSVSDLTLERSHAWCMPGHGRFHPILRK
jgi:hypothetical protein